MKKSDLDTIIIDMESKRGKENLGMDKDINKGYMKENSVTTNRKILAENRRKIKRRRMRKFFAIVFSMILSFILLSGAAIFSYVKLMLSPEEQKNISTLVNRTVTEAMDVNIGGLKRGRITVLLLGVDKESETRTDVIMIATVNKKTNQVDLISIPRDTRITIPMEVRNKLKAKGKWYPSDGKIKLTEFNAYCADLDNSIELLESFIEDLLNITIDYYAKINTEAFAKVVDKVGGIEYKVETSMYYNDPLQGLYINLKPGVQILNGKQAEGLVRYRSYVNGDYTRVKVQQEFLKVAFKQIMEKVSADKLVGLAIEIFPYIETDFDISGIPEAISVARKIDSTSINTHTIPSRTQTIVVGEVPVSYVIHDQAGTEELIESIWYPEKFQDEKEAVKWIEY